MSEQKVVNVDKLNKYSEFIFSFLKDNKVGHGLFLNTIIFKAEDTYSREEFKEFYLIFDILHANGYFSISDQPKYFVKLTQKGFDYLHGDESLIPYVELYLLLDSNRKDQNELSNDLWKVIGKEDALFYVNGTLFYYTIQPYLSDLPPQYGLYMQDLKERSKSTSRVSWYRELFLRLSTSDCRSFLNELSTKINSAIDQELANPDLEEEIFDIGWSSLNESTVEPESYIIANPQKVNTPASIISEFTPTTEAPHVFISYAWEEGVNEWVEKLSEDLRSSGINAKIDQYLTHGSDLVKFMRDELGKSDRVLIIITEIYKQKVESGRGGASYEGSIISHSIYNEQGTDKFIPLVRKGTFEKTCPDFISGRKGIDFSDDSEYEDKLAILVDILKGNDVDVPPLKM